MDAEGGDRKEATMQLSLRGYHAELQESLVIHEFGHALGLEHEHQRSDFWKIIGKHLDLEEMKKDPLVSPSSSEEGKAAFGKDWLAMPTISEAKTESDCNYDYDPLSIMHYW